MKALKVLSILLLALFSFSVVSAAPQHKKRHHYRKHHRHPIHHPVHHR